MNNMIYLDLLNIIFNWKVCDFDIYGIAMDRECDLGIDLLMYHKFKTPVEAFNALGRDKCTKVKLRTKDGMRILNENNFNKYKDSEYSVVILNDIYDENPTEMEYETIKEYYNDTIVNRTGHFNWLFKKSVENTIGIWFSMYPLDNYIDEHMLDTFKEYFMVAKNEVEVNFVLDNYEEFKRNPNTFIMKNRRKQ